MRRSGPMRGNGGTYRRRVIIFGALLLTAGGGSLGAMVIEQSPEEAVKAAELIVEGTLGEVRPSPGEQHHGWEYAVAPLKVEHILKQPSGHVVEGAVRIRFTRPLPEKKSEVGGGKHVTVFPGTMVLPVHGYTEGQRGIWLLRREPGRPDYVPVHIHQSVRALADRPELMRQLGKEGGKAAQSIAPVRPNFELGFTWKPDPQRLIVAAVRPASAAAEGKFEIGDVVMEVEGQALNAPHIFLNRVGEYQPGVKVQVKVERAGTLKKLFLTRPPAAGAPGVSPIPRTPGRLGGYFTGPEPMGDSPPGGPTNPPSGVGKPSSGFQGPAGRVTGPPPGVDEFGVRLADLIVEATLKQVVDTTHPDGGVTARGVLEVTEVLFGEAKRQPAPFAFTKRPPKGRLAQPEHFTEGQSGLWSLSWNDGSQVFRSFGGFRPVEAKDRIKRLIQELRK